MRGENKSGGPTLEPPPVNRLVAHAGFEPAVSALRGQRPRPLDECATSKLGRIIAKNEPAVKSSPLQPDKENTMHVYEADDWRQYQMNWYDPHRKLEPFERETAIVDGALTVLVRAGVLPHARYDVTKMLAHRAAVRERFDIPWTAISPRMQHLLYAINAIARPQVMVAVGIFCGNTFISNGGAAIGPGACYRADRLVGLEIRPREADRARRNVAAIHDSPSAGARRASGDGECSVEILGQDGLPWLREVDTPIDLLYLDADGPAGSGKSIYYDLLQAALHALPAGSLVLAHNSVNSARSMADYLAYVRDPNCMRASVNLIVDDQGLEASVR
jgi:predicted O-methyltransferase YrrM